MTASDDKDPRRSDGGGAAGAETSTADGPAGLDPAPHLSRRERLAAGRAEREKVPLKALGGWAPAADRADPVDVITAQEQDRLQVLLPIRHGRMLRDAFGFYRGAAAVMAADLGAGPRTGLTVQLCGDAHLLNFGAYGSPERSLVFDVNDFDETIPGPFEWDVKRLVTSIAVCARNNGLGEKKVYELALAAARTYRECMAMFAEMDTLAVWYTQLGVDEVIAGIHDPAVRRDAQRVASKATSRDSAQAAAKLTTVAAGRRTIDSQPPLVVPFRELAGWFDAFGAKRIRELVRSNFAAYRRSLRPDVLALVDRYEMVDMALKVVGVGSVGTRCAIVLMQGRDVDDVLFLQVKEAVRSVAEPFTHKSRYRHQGERVVVGQRLTQSSSDIFLGWSNGGELGDYYWRQLRDWKASVAVETMDAVRLDAYGDLCAWTLAKGHARSGDPVAISSYLGTKDRFDRALADFAIAYADQNEADFERLTAAAAAGRIEVAESF